MNLMKALQLNIKNGSDETFNRSSLTTTTGTKAVLLFWVLTVIAYQLNILMLFLKTVLRVQHATAVYIFMNAYTKNFLTNLISWEKIDGKRSWARTLALCRVDSSFGKSSEITPIDQMARYSAALTSYQILSKINEFFLDGEGCYFVNGCNAVSNDLLMSYYWSLLILNWLYILNKECRQTRSCQLPKAVQYSPATPTEIFVGILANMCDLKKTRNELCLQESQLVEAQTDLSGCLDALTLQQLMRLWTTDTSRSALKTPISLQQGDFKP
uniref:Uncharacterized protein n=1 Tax=Glossina palpalis gambiensis TaxID=67801 RepID=A0A1B0BGB1_9MUSC